MLKIICEGKKKQSRVYRFRCGKCDCVWITDEARTFLKYEGYSDFNVSDCPCCGNKDVVAYGLDY